MFLHKLYFLAVFAALAFLSGSSTAGQAKEAVVETALVHDSMEMRIGYPAIIKPGGSYPSVEIKSGHQGELAFQGEIIRECDGSVDRQVTSQSLGAGASAVISLGDGTPDEGRYRFQFRLLDGGQTVFMDAYYFSVFDPGKLPGNYSRVVHPGDDGKLVYIPDYRGNRIPDFSRAGYMGGGVALPQAPVRVTLEPEPGDDRPRIQAAIDEVSALEPDENGIRGAVLLKKGVYVLGNDLRIRADGVVLRGEGSGGDKENLWHDPDNWKDMDELKEHLSGRNATVLIRPARATGGLLRVSGGGITTDRETETEIIDNYVPVGAHTFSVENPENFSVGDSVMVRRRGNPQWISEIGMDRIPGKSAWGGSRFFEYDFERTITSVDGSLITIDSPILAAIEKRWGGGSVFKYDDSARVRQVGLEGMRVILYDALRGGRLSHMRGVAANFNNFRDVWVRDIVAEHFHDRVFTISDGKNITVEDSSVLMAPDRFISGYVPRYGFFPRGGANHVLIKSCHAKNNRHAYVICAWVKGPHVILDSTHDNPVSWSEPHHRWAAGGLFDNVRDMIGLMNRLSAGSGHGWSAANYVAWNTRGQLVCQQPPTAQNWSIGHVGRQAAGRNHAWNREQFGYSDGYWELHRVSDRESLDPDNPGLEAFVTASGYEWGRTPVGTLDDDPDTYWMAQGRGEWIQYDLGQKRQVNALEISFPHQDAPIEGRIYFFDIALSEDGRRWIAVKNRAEGPSDGPDVFHRYEFPGTQARYVRITSRGSNMSRDGSPGSVVFHMSRVRIDPRPDWDAEKMDVPGVYPRSLYLRQLRDRLGADALRSIGYADDAVE